MVVSAQTQGRDMEPSTHHCGFEDTTKLTVLLHSWMKLKYTLRPITSYFQMLKKQIRELVSCVQLDSEL